MTADPILVINGTSHVPIDAATADEIVARAIEKASADVDNVPAAAAEVATWTGDKHMPRDRIVTTLMDAAPRETPERQTEIRKRAAKAIRKVRDRAVRGFVEPRVDEITELAMVREGKRAEALRRRIRRELDEEEAADAEDALGDLYADVAEIIERGVERRAPDAGGIRNDGARLSYSAAVNGLVGPPESGKTLVSVAQACDELTRGGSVLHVDADHNGDAATVSQYMSFGVAAETLGDPARFRYVELRSADHMRRVIADAPEWTPSVVIVDSVGEVVGLFGGDSNSNDDYRRIHREAVLPFARLGAAVLLLDHVTKADGTAGYAIGASAKKAAIDGSYLAVAVVEPFVPGVGGAAALSILKDRHGGLRAVSPSGKSPTAAVFRLDSRGGSSTWEFWRGRDVDEKAAAQAAADVAALRDLDPPPRSKTDVKTRMSWGSDRAFAALTTFREQQLTTFPLDPETHTDERKADQP